MLQKKSSLHTNLSFDTVFCTYCSAEKDPSDFDLPAVRRYLSTRIESLYEVSLLLKIHFFILSGEFGLIQPDEKIPFYDHLLRPDEVPEKVKLVVAQLQSMPINNLIFWGKSPEIDTQLVPYYECINLACKEAEVKFRAIFLK